MLIRYQFGNDLQINILKVKGCHDFVAAEEPQQPCKLGLAKLFRKLRQNLNDTFDQIFTELALFFMIYQLYDIIQGGGNCMH